MPMELLRKLANEPLPTTITDAEEVDRARVLHAAGQIACTFSELGAVEQFARVIAITRDGKAALALHCILGRRKGGA